MTATTLPWDGIVHADLDPDTLQEVLNLIDPLLGRDVPEWGSPAWLALPLEHPDREAATLLAAHSWWAAKVFGSGVPGSVLRQQVLIALKAVSLDVAKADDWPALVDHHRAQQRAQELRINGYGAVA